MPVPATTGQLRTKVSEMEIGDYIKMYQKQDTFLAFTSDPSIAEMPVTGQAVGTTARDKFWYMVKVAKGLLVGDRVTMHTWSWDSMNTSKYIQGLPFDNGNILPTMTSDILPSGKVTTNVVPIANTDAYKAFDKNGGTYWHSTAGVTTGWLAYEFPEPKVIRGYSILPQANYLNRSPKNWTFEGSNDGVTWDMLDDRNNQTAWVNGVKNNYLVGKPGSYKMYRINVTANCGLEYLAIAELEMFDTAGTIRSLTGGVAYVDAEGNRSLTDQGLGGWPANNEWDRYIVNFPTDKIQPGKALDDVFHVHKNEDGANLPFTWCQETPSILLPSGANTSRISRGRLGENYFSYSASTTSAASYGFRPVFQYKEEV